MTATRGSITHDDRVGDVCLSQRSVNNTGVPHPCLARVWRDRVGILTFVGRVFSWAAAPPYTISSGGKTGTGKGINGPLSPNIHETISSPPASSRTPDLSARLQTHPWVPHLSPI